MTLQSLAKPRDAREVGLSIDEVAHRLGRHRATVCRYVKAGYLDAVTVGPNRKLITWESLERLLSGGAA